MRQSRSLEAKLTILTTGLHEKAPMGVSQWDIRHRQAGGSLWIAGAMQTGCMACSPEARGPVQGWLCPRGSGSVPPGDRRVTSPAGTARSWRPRWHPAC